MRRLIATGHQCFAATMMAVLIMIAGAGVGCSNGTETGASDQQNVASDESNTDGVYTSDYKTCDEWTALYPLEGESFAKSKMSGTYDSFYGACTEAFGLEDAPFACASCHARNQFHKVYAEEGEACLVKNASDYEASDNWSNCTNCHVGDPGDGVVKGGNEYGTATSSSASKWFSEEDMVCGQCHSEFPGTAYLESANTGIDQYKYGYDPDSLLKAYKEFYAANPITSSGIGAGMVGVPEIDEATGATLYLTDSCTALEVFQDSTHQSMGLTCTDCHMPKTTAEDGTEYTSHYTSQSPIENPDALSKCLTCHKSQGIEDADAMVTFVKGKINDLSVAEQQTQAKVMALHDTLAAAVAQGNVDANAITAAQDAYSTANAYLLWQGGANSTGEECVSGVMAAMNYSECMDLCAKADTLCDDAIASLQ